MGDCIEDKVEFETSGGSNVLDKLVGSYTIFSCIQKCVAESSVGCLGVTLRDLDQGNQSCELLTATVAKSGSFPSSQSMKTMCCKNILHTLFI